MSRKAVVSSSNLIPVIFLLHSLTFFARGFVLEIPSAILSDINNGGGGGGGGGGSRGNGTGPVVDCAVGEWSAWQVSPSDPAAGNGETRFIRSRQIILTAQNGGKPCPSLFDLRTVKRGDTFDPNVAEIEATPTTTTTTAPVKTTTTEIDFGVESVKKRDILFLVDMSGSLSEMEFAKVMDSLSIIVDRLCEEVTPGVGSPLRIAMATFDHRIHTNFDFKKYTNKEQIKSALKMTRPMGGATCTGEALQYAADVMLQEERGSRPDATRDVLLLTDGLWNCGVDAQLAAEKLKQKANVYSLLIGHFTPSGYQQMHSLLSGPSDTHLFSLRNVDQLHKLIHLLESDFPLRPFRGCAPARLDIAPRQPMTGSTIVVPELRSTPSRATPRRSTIVHPQTTVGQVKTTIGQITNDPWQQTKIPITPGQEKTTIGQVTNTPGQEKTTLAQINNTPGQAKTTMGQYTSTPGQEKPRNPNWGSSTVGQEKTTIGQFTNTPGQAKTTLGHIIGQEKTTIGQFTNTPGQAKTTIGQFTNTPGQRKTTARFGNYVSPSIGQEKTTIGQFTNTPGQAKTTIGQFTNTPGQVKTTAAPIIGQETTTMGQFKTTGNNPWPWQQKTTRGGQITFGPYQRTTNVRVSPGQEKTTIGQFKTSAGRLEANQITTRAPYPVKG